MAPLDERGWGIGGDRDDHPSNAIEALDTLLLAKPLNWLFD